jgi:proteasome accessory factor B
VQKLERLLNLIAVLLHTGRPLTAAELRERVPGYPEGDVAFRRAFERDKDDLRELSVPLELIPVPGADPPVEGYRIPRDRYYLPDPGLEPDELAALQLAAATVRLDGTGTHETLWTLGGTAPGEHARALSADLPSDPALGPLFEAISARSAVQFGYRGEQRSVQPYRLGFQLGRWYLRAFDLDRDDMRVFRLDRIDGVVEVGAAGSFEIPDDERGPAEILPDRWELGSAPPLVARVRIDASHAPVAMVQFDPDDVVATNDDGSIDVRVMVANHDAFRSLVFGYLEHAEVLGPPELRDEITSWLHAVAGASS